MGVADPDVAACIVPPVDRGIEHRWTVSRMCSEVARMDTRHGQPWHKPKVDRGPLVLSEGLDQNFQSPPCIFRKSTLGSKSDDMFQIAIFKSVNVGNITERSSTPRITSLLGFANFTPQMLGFSPVLPENHKMNKYRRKTITNDKLK